MHFVTSFGKYMAFCGKHSIYVVALRSIGPHLVTIDVLNSLPRNTPTNLEKNSLTCLEFSRDTKFLCTADSDKRVYIFERIDDTRWVFQCAFDTEKRCVKLQFDSKSTTIIMTDKCGDVWLSYMTVKTIQPPTKIICHSSVILDTLISGDNRTIFTSDCDGKILVSKFPEAFTVDHYFVGHKSPVVSIALVEQELLLLSLDSSGKLKLWCRADKRCMSTYDIFHIFHGPGGSNKSDDDDGMAADVLCMRVTEALDSIWLAVKIFGYKEIPILKLKYLTKDVRKVGQVRMESEFCDMCWNHHSLFVYTPCCAVKKFDATQHGLIVDAKFSIQSSIASSHDVREFVSFNKQPFLASLQLTSNESLALALPETLYTKSKRNNHKNKITKSATSPISQRLEDLTLELCDEEELTLYEEADDDDDDDDDGCDFIQNDDQNNKVV